MQWINGNETEFLIRLVFSLICGFVLGYERELRGKSAGIGTHSFVIGGAMLFTFLSPILGPSNTALVAAGVVTGIGFLGAGMILKEGDGKDGRVVNLTTAANIWFSAAIGMAIGVGWYLIALIATVYAILVPWLHHLGRHKK